MNSLKALIACSAVAMTACTHSNYYFDEAAHQAQLKKEYTDNFVNKFSGVSLDQSWDYSSKQPVFSFGSAASNAATRADGEWGFSVSDDYYYIQDGTLSWMKDKLAEGRNNSSRGKAFYMTVPNNDFYIVPIYQGNASAVWQLNIVVNGQKLTNVWSKAQLIEIKSKETNQEWTPISKKVGNTMSADETRSKAIKISGLPAGAEMYFELEVTTGAWPWCEQGDLMRSIDHKMLALTVPTPTNLKEGSEAMIIGCEDARDGHTDDDYNDIVFLVYGDPGIPKPVDLEEGDMVTETTTVRYMIEDLGATDDFDFNDIVVDVADIKETTPIYVNGKLAEWQKVNTYQKAYIRHLGGTLPFILKVGETTLPELGGKETFQTSPNREFDVKGWNMNEHNVKIMVRQMGSLDVFNELGFPKSGEVPMIIAVDADKEWMSERVSIPASWFTTVE